MDESLDRLGELLVRGFRSHAIGLLDDLARAAELVVADWNSSQVVPLADEPAVAAYLRGEPDAEPGAAADGGGRVGF